MEEAEEVFVDSEDFVEEVLVDLLDFEVVVDNAEAVVLVEEEDLVEEALAVEEATDEAATEEEAGDEEVSEELEDEEVDPDDEPSHTQSV